MILKIASQFAADFKTINDPTLRDKIKNVLETIKKAKGVQEIPHFKKIKGDSTSYKMGIGFYFLVGQLTSETEITLIRFLHRDVVVQTID